MSGLYNAFVTTRWGDWAWQDKAITARRSPLIPLLWYNNHSVEPIMWWLIVRTIQCVVRLSCALFSVSYTVCAPHLHCRLSESVTDKILYVERRFLTGSRHITSCVTQQRTTMHRQMYNVDLHEIQSQRLLTSRKRKYKVDYVIANIWAATILQFDVCDLYANCELITFAKYTHHFTLTKLRFRIK